MGAALELRSVTKSFVSTRALGGVDLRLEPGEVHALAGVNGAGKSTLIRIIAGALAPDGGEVVVAGAPVRFRRPSDAARSGVAVVHQETSLVASLSLEDALLVGLDRGPLFGLLRTKERRARARRMLDAVQLDAPLDTPVEALPLAVRQLAEIGRALSTDPRVLVLDEPTSALGEADSDVLLDRVRSMRERGVAVLFCSHRLDEVYRIADRITVLRDGRVVAADSVRRIGRAELVSAMLGAELETTPPMRSERSSTRRLELRDVTIEKRGSSRRELDRVGLEVAAGEIVGLAAVRGGGSEALIAFVAGLSRGAGAMTLDGEPYAPRSATEAADRGVLFLAADRRHSVIADLNVRWNTSLSALRRGGRGRWIRTERERREVEHAAKRVSLHTGGTSPDIERSVRVLSGGNQQKVAFARCLMAEPRLLCLHEPSRGVDVGAQRDIHALIGEIARAGTSVLVASSETDELVSICDRIVVLAAGRIVGAFERPFDREALAHAVLQTGVAQS